MKKRSQASVRRFFSVALAVVLAGSCLVFSTPTSISAHGLKASLTPGTQIVQTPIPQQSKAFSEPNTATRREALPVSAGIEALRGQFEAGQAGEEDGFALDYGYYSPVGENDPVKYPIVIYLHGLGHGWSVGSQVADSDMPYWASSEMQAKWTSGGCFILMPRCPENQKQFWGKALAAPVRKCIDDFIEAHRENVDTTRIFVGGCSAGGEMAWHMITLYPDYFAGAFPMSATGFRTADEVKAARNVPVWLFDSIFDPLVNYTLNILPTWSLVRQYSAAPESCRFSTFTLVCNPDGRIAGENHRVYQTIDYDFFTIDGKPYPNVKTVNARGETVTFEYPNGMISWMCGLQSSYDGSSNIEGGSFNEFSALMKNFLFRIVNFVQRQLGIL